MNRKFIQYFLLLFFVCLLFSLAIEVYAKDSLMLEWLKKLEFSYSPPFLPVSISFGPNGLQVTGERSIVTPIGEFGVGSSFTVIEREIQKVKETDLLLVIRDKTIDKLYTIKGAQAAHVEVEGKTFIIVQKGYVQVNISDGEVNTLKFIGDIPSELREREQSLHVSRLEGLPETTSLLPVDKDDEIRFNFINLPPQNKEQWK